MAIIQGGRFTSDGTSKILQIRSGVDYIRVINTTIAAGAQTTAIGVEHYWQRGFPNGSQYMYLKSNAAAAADLTQYLTTGGFSLADTSVIQLGVLNNGSTGISAISNATPPVVTVGSTASMAPGAIVRLFNVAGASQAGGVDYTVGYNTFSGTTFSLDYATSFGAGVGATGSFRVVPYDVQFYPAARYIASITQAAQAVVKMTVTHGYLPGQTVRFVIPVEFGMIELDGLTGTIVSVDTTTTTGNTITVDIDSSSFTAFAWPASGGPAFTFAQVIPVGDDTAFDVENNLDISSGATQNTSYIGMRLAGGASLPGGANGNVMYWTAGNFDRIDNQ